MRRIFAIFVVFAVILASSAAQAAVVGDIKLSVEISGLNEMMKQFLAQMGQGGQLPARDAPLGDSTLTTSGKILIEGNNLRISLIDPSASLAGAGAGGASTIEIMLNKGDNRIYVYYPDTLNGMYVDLGKTEPGGLAESGALVGNRNFADAIRGANVTTVGKKSVLGRNCTGYKVLLNKEAGKTMEVDMWVADDLGFPIAVRSRSDYFNMTWEVTNAKSTPDKGGAFYRPPGNAALKESTAAGLMSLGAL